MEKQQSWQKLCYISRVKGLLPKTKERRMVQMTVKQRGKGSTG